MEDQTARIEAYSEAFSRWYAENPNPTESEQLERLSRHHTEILEKVAELRELTSIDLRNLKKKGKGILAYTDVLPKRISFGRKRKG